MKQEVNTLNLTFEESWFLQEEELDSFKIKILEDLGECMDWIENEDGILEWTKVHKYKVKIVS